MSNERFKPTEYKIEAGDQAGTVLGPLESEVMKVAWSFGKRSFTVREVFEDLKRSRSIAYTTVMTTMNSLFRKGLLSRRVTRGKGGLLYSYQAAMSLNDLERQTIRDVLRSLWKNFGKEALTSSFIDEIQIKPEELEKLLERESTLADQDTPTDS